MANSNVALGNAGEFPDDQPIGNSLGHAAYADIAIPPTAHEVLAAAGYAANPSQTLLHQVLADTFLVERAKQSMRDAHDYASNEMGPFQIHSTYGILVSLKLPQFLSLHLHPVWRRKVYLTQVRHVSPSARYSGRVQIVSLNGKLEMVNTTQGEQPSFTINPKSKKSLWQRMVQDNTQAQNVLTINADGSGPEPMQPQPMVEKVHTLALITGRAKGGVRLGFLADPYKISKIPNSQRARMMVHDFSMILNDDGLPMIWPQVAAEMSGIEDVEVDIEPLDEQESV